MGINIRWEDEFGTLLEEILDPKDYFGFALALSPLDKTVCLRFIDPYGDTVFNQQQIPVFISELQGLQQFIMSEQFTRLCEKLKTKYRAANVEISEHVSKILELAQRTRNELHTYLKFYGD